MYSLTLIDHFHVLLVLSYEFCSNGAAWDAADMCVYVVSYLSSLLLVFLYICFHSYFCSQRYFIYFKCVSCIQTTRAHGFVWISKINNSRLFAHFGHYLNECLTDSLFFFNQPPNFLSIQLFHLFDDKISYARWNFPLYFMHNKLKFIDFDVISCLFSLFFIRFSMSFYISTVKRCKLLFYDAQCKCFVAKMSLKWKLFQ